MSIFLRYSISFWLIRVFLNTITKFRYDVLFGRSSYVNLNTYFEGGNVLSNNVECTNSWIGFGSYIANNSKISSTKIGRFCAIGNNVHTCLGAHPTERFVSIHPAFFSVKKQAGFSFIQRQRFQEHKFIGDDNKWVCIIGNDVWIGNNVSIMDGITIGDGAIIGLGSVVTGDVEPYSINVGVPAKKIGYRFTGDERRFLLKFKWWEKDVKWIKKNANLFDDIEKLKSSFNKQEYCIPPIDEEING